MYFDTRTALHTAERIGRERRTVAENERRARVLRTAAAPVSTPWTERRLKRWLRPRFTLRRRDPLRSGRYATRC